MQRHPGASILAAALALVAPQAPPSQNSRPAAVSGVAVDGTTGAPVAGAIVWMRQLDPRGATLRQYTDAQGRFVFMGLRPGVPSMLTAEKTGYQLGAYAQRFPGDDSAPEIRLDDGQWLRDVKVPLWRPSAIEGTVVDEQHEPVVGALVRVLQEFPIGGTTQLLPGPSVRTDDRGTYRAGRLAPGRYLVVVDSRAMTAPSEVLNTPPFLDELLSPPTTFAIDRESAVLVRWLAKPMRRDGDGWWTYPTTYYPSAPSTGQAVAIDLGGSETRAGVDVALEPVRAFRVSGTVAGPAAALVDLDVRLIASGDDRVGSIGEIASARVAADGSFAIAGVPSGSYVVEATHRRTDFHTGGLSGFDVVPSLPSIRTSASLTGIAVGPPGTMLVTRTSEPPALNWFGRTTVAVANRDAANVTVPLSEGVQVSGRVEWEHVAGGSIAPALYLDSRDLGASASSTQVRVPADGRFTITGLIPGRYIFGHRDAGTIKSVRWHGEDRSSQGFDLSGSTSIADVIVTLTDNGGTVAGTVHDAAGAPSAAAVICFPIDPAAWHDFGLHPHRLGAVATDLAGQYQVASLPEGEYFFVAVPLADEDRWQDATFLAAAAPTASRVTVHWGARVHEDLTVRRVSSAQ